jgi:hypothetical protein
MSKSRVEKALDRIFEETPMEYTIEVYEARDFVEVVGRAGGDVLTYRVYDSGAITAR